MPPEIRTGDRVLGPSPARDMFAARIGASLNPRRIASILAQADQGQPAALHDLANELRQKDASLHSLLQSRELALLACGYSIAEYIAPGEDDPSDEDREIAAFCREAVEDIRCFERSLSHLLDGNVKAYSVCETEWKKSGRHVVPAELHNIAGRRFAITTDQRLVWYDNGDVSPPRDVFAESPHRFVLHAPRVNGDSLSREGLARCLVWFACFENWAWRDWILFAELFGKPWRIAMMGETYQAADDNEIHGVLESLTASTYAVLPKGVDLKIEWPSATGQTGGSPSAAIIDKCTEWKALAILGQRMTIADSKNGLGGSGDARDAVRKDILRADGRALGEALRWQLLAPLVRFNFGPAKRVPYFCFDTEDEKDLKAYAETIDILADRIEIPAREVYDVTGIRQPLDGEPVLKARQQAPAVAPAPAEAPEAEDEDEEPEDGPPEPEDE